MKKISLLVAILCFSIVLTSPANALIKSWNCAADGDGAIEMDYTALTYDGTEGGIAVYTMDMDGVQSRGPAHVLGDFITDTETDPIVWIMEDVDNVTGFTWTGYQFAIYMNKVFTIEDVVAPEGWSYIKSAVIPGQPLPVGTGTGYMGLVTYTAGAGYEIANGNTGTFGVKTKFVGSVAFCTEQTPIPEPMTVAMLGLGGLLIRRKK
jgi:hypothetical protein